MKQPTTPKGVLSAASREAAALRLKAIKAAFILANGETRAAAKLLGVPEPTFKRWLAADEELRKWRDARFPFRARRRSGPLGPWSRESRGGLRGRKPDAGWKLTAMIGSLSPEEREAMEEWVSSRGGKG